MKKIISILLLLILSDYCFSQEKKDSANSGVEQYIKMSTLYRFIVIAGTSTNFNSLDLSAKQISKKTEIPYNNDGMMYDKQLGMIFPKDTLKYDNDAGQSFPRRYDENRISLEMLHFYNNHYKPNDTTMIIITGIFENKKDAERQLKLIQYVVPGAYIKKPNYTWDVPINKNYTL